MKAQYQIVLRRDVLRQVQLDTLALRAGIHPTLVEHFVELRLIEPVDWAGSSPLFDVSAIRQLRTIQRLRRDLGVNLAGVEVILEMVGRLRALQSELDRLRTRL